MCVVDFDPPVFVFSKWRRARKPHKCDECGWLIRPGTRYEHTSGKWDECSRVYSYAHCELCAELSEAVSAAECSWCYQSLLDDAQATLLSYEHAEEQPAAVGRVAGLMFAIAERGLLL